MCRFRKQASFIVTIAAMAQLLVCTSLHAADTKSESKGQRTYTAIGVRTCKSWLADEGKAKAVSQNAEGLSFISDEGWLVGFLSGANSMSFSQPDYLSGLDLQTAADWVDAYCKKNEDKNVADAALALLAKLSGEGKN